MKKSELTRMVRKEVANITEADEKIRPKSGSAPSKKEKAEMNDALYNVMKKFKQLGGGYVEVASEQIGRGYYNIKYQIARMQKSGKHRDWVFFHVDKKGNVEITPKQEKMFKAGNLKNPNKVAKVLNTWSDENLLFGESVNEAEVTLPAGVRRFMSKFIAALKGSNLNRKRQIAVLGGVVDSMGIDPSKLMQIITKIKRGMNVDEGRYSLPIVIEAVLIAEFRKGLLKESTDTFDYNEIVIEEMQDEVNGYTKSWLKNDRIMEESYAYKVLKKYDKLLAVLMKKCDKELQRF
jgi:hypothetical protein